MENPFETITRTSFLYIGKCLTLMSKCLFHADFLDRFVGLMDTIYSTYSIEE